MTLAGDALTWSTQAVNTSAPATLTQAQLNRHLHLRRHQLVPGRRRQPGHPPFLPQSGSGTLSAWLTAIGVTTPGPCVSSVNNTLEENEGVNPVLKNPGAIFPYSVGDYIAQTVHSAVPDHKTTCTAKLQRRDLQARAG